MKIIWNNFGLFLILIVCFIILSGCKTIETEKEHEVIILEGETFVCPDLTNFMNCLGHGIDKELLLYDLLEEFGFELECVENKTVKKHKLIESVEDCISEIERKDYCEGDGWCLISTFIGDEHIKNCEDKIPYIIFWNVTVCAKEQLVKYK